MPHIFPVVRKYIQDQIMAKSNSHAQAVNEGVNALKNAYDDGFKEKLVEMGPKMLDFKYYYKGYAYIPTSYYYFEYEEREKSTDLNKELEYWYEPEQNTSKYYDVYLKDWKHRKATVFNGDFGQDLVYKKEEQAVSLDNFENVYVKTGADKEGSVGRHLFSEYHTHFDMKDLFDLENCSYSSVSDIPEKSDLYSLSAEMSTSDSIIKMKIIKSDFKERYKKLTTDMPVSYKSRYKLFNGNLTGVSRDNLWESQDVSKVTSKMGWGLGWNFDQNLAPWCNVFASDLSNYIYGKVEGNYPVPYGNGGMTAKKLHSHFISEINNYINLHKEEESYDKEKIWDLIDEGYPVYFSTKKHIETGFPDESKNNGNKTYFNEKRRYAHNDPTSNNNTIGAGNNVGYATYGDYRFLKYRAAVFLYLEYLKKEY